MAYPASSDKMKQYFDMLTQYTQTAFSIAENARKKGLDPETNVEIKLAEDVAGRVEGLVGPKGIAKIIREMEHKGMDRQVLAAEVVKKIVKGEVVKKSKEELLDLAVRVGVGILTEGVLVAPTEGIGKIKIGKNADGSERIDMYYAGPIRSAGGTIAALSVVLADVARRELKIEKYRPTDSEIERYVEEVDLYDRRCARLQYKPTDNEVRTIAKNVPICINGEPTHDIEISVHRNVHGVTSNKVRGGVALVIGEGIAQKAPKILKYTKKIGLDGWEWVESIVKVKTKKSAVEIKPLWTFISELIAGRPVFSYPSAKGGFRLRYGRSPMTGVMSKGFHPATLEVLDGFLAIGTQAKIERPGKGCIITVCENIEGPVVLLKNGKVMKLKTREDAINVNDKIKKVLFVGDMLVPIGDMLKSGHPIVPDAWCEEWWNALLKEKGITIGDLKGWEIVNFSYDNNLPLHPNFTKPWSNITKEDVLFIKEYLEKEYDNHGNSHEPENLTLNYNDEIKRILEELYVEHHVEEKDGQQGAKVIVIDEHPSSLFVPLGLWKLNENNQSKSNIKYDTTLDFINTISPIEIKNWASFYIGVRMGRPEKAKMREMKPPVHSLFPVGEYDRTRNIPATVKMLEANGKSLYIDIAKRRCPKCGTKTIFLTCDICGTKTVPVNNDKKYDKKAVNLSLLWKKALKKLNIPPPQLVKGVKGMMSIEKIPERLEKGILRAKHKISVYKDGTSRFDATDVPITHFRPKDINTSVEKLKEMGYEKDYMGNPLEHDDQIVEIFPQDIIINEDAEKFLFRTANFIDELLVKFYNMKPFYNLKTPEDVVGHLCIGLAPHISGGTIVRVIGTTPIRGTLGHPYFHMAKRRNCFHKDELIPVFNGKYWKILTFKELYDSIRLTPKTDPFKSEIKKVYNLKTISFNLKTKKFEIKPISHVTKHPSPQHLIKIKTKSGMELITTGDHPFPNIINGHKQSASKIEKIAMPEKITIPESDLTEFDLKQYSKDVMIKMNKKIIMPEDYKKILKKLKITYKNLTNYIYRKSYPVEMLNKLKIAIPKTAKITAKRDNVIINQFVKNDKDFLFILGFYLAEGYLKKQNKLSYTTNLCTSDNNMKEIISKKVYKVFGVKPSINKNTITISSRIIYNFFERLGVGKGAYKKNVPDFVFSLPLNKLKHFLKGYFHGDGSCSLGSTLEVSCTSVCKKLMYQISFLLLRYGIRNTIRKSERTIKSKIILQFYGKGKYIKLYKLRIYADHAAKFIKNIGFCSDKDIKARNLLKTWKNKRKKTHSKKIGEALVETVKSKEFIKYSGFVYSITVPETHTLLASNITTFNCDGDEDAIMLLMDALLNFSLKFKPELRGGSMDMPIVLTTIINPKEVDDEVLNMEISSEYPLSFFEAAERFEKNLEGIKLVNDVLGTAEQYEGFKFTHHINKMDDGPIKSKYVEFKLIHDKVFAQLAVQDKIKAVDNKDAAERVILSHFIPDLYGNLRKFSQQTFRCVQCNTIYRRPPLKGKCLKCGGKLVLTIHEGSVRKYYTISKEIAEKYDLPKYLKQRLMLLEKDMDSLFVDEQKEQLNLTEFL